MALASHFSARAFVQSCPLPPRHHPNCEALSHARQSVVAYTTPLGTLHFEMQLLRAATAPSYFSRSRSHRHIESLFSRHFHLSNSFFFFFDEVSFNHARGNHLTSEQGFPQLQRSPTLATVCPHPSVRLGSASSRLHTYHRPTYLPNAT